MTCSKNEAQDEVHLCTGCPLMTAVSTFEFESICENQFHSNEAMQVIYFRAENLFKMHKGSELLELLCFQTLK